MDFSPLYDVSPVTTPTKGAKSKKTGDGAPSPDAETGDVTLHVHVAPGAGRSAVVGRHGDALKLRIAAPPVGGRANEAARSLLADAFGLKEGAVSLVSGEGSRQKRFMLAAVDLEDFERRLRVLIEPPGSDKRRPDQGGRVGRV